MLPPAVSAIAYAASLADTIIIDAIVWSNGQFCPGVRWMHMHSRPAALGVTEITAVGGSRSTATSAVMIFTVLAGGSASWRLRLVNTAPVAASTTTNDRGGGTAW